MASRQPFIDDNQARVQFLRQGDYLSLASIQISKQISAPWISKRYHFEPGCPSHFGTTNTRGATSKYLIPHGWRNYDLTIQALQ